MFFIPLQRLPLPQTRTDRLPPDHRTPLPLHDQSLPPSHSLWRRSCCRCCCCCCCCCGNQCTYVCTLILARTIASARLLARVFAFGHLFYFLFIFSTMRQAACVQWSTVQRRGRRQDANGADVRRRGQCALTSASTPALLERYRYIFLYILFFIRARTQ